MEPLQKLMTEIRRLRSLYFTSVYSLQKAQQDLQFQLMQGKINPKDPVLLNPSNPESVELAGNAYALLTKMKQQFRRYLRETIFVRLISSLEVYFIDVLREIFLERRDLFHTQNPTQFTVGEILSANSLTYLWTKLLNREVRSLQNQGFKEITKYYKNRLNIDCNKFNKSISIIEEYHDRRHILVHRLGRTDETYKHKYNSTEKTLTVTEEYLISSIQTIIEFAQFLDEEAKNIIEDKNKPRKKKAEYRREYEIEHQSNESEKYTNPEYHFKTEESVIGLKDILVSIRNDDKTQFLIVEGSYVDVRAYTQRLKKLERKGLIRLKTVKSQILTEFKRKQTDCNLPTEIIEAIAKSLPNLPFEEQVHKSVAKQFNISNKQAYKALELILGDETLSASIGGQSS